MSVTEPKKYLTIASVQEVWAALYHHAWSPYARITGRDDVPIYDHKGVREADGELWVNAGEWHWERGYLNEEWMKPQFVYIKHKCDGCHYPPNMCCLQPPTRYTYDSFYEVDDIDDDEDYDEDYERIMATFYSLPEGVYPRTLEIAPAL